MKKNLPFLANISNEELGLDQEEVGDVISEEAQDSSSVIRKALMTKPKVQLAPKIR